MSRRTLKVLVLIVGIATLVAWGPLSALPLRGPAPGQPQGFFASLWGSLTSLWSANGCELDPSGRCITSRGTAPAHAGRGTGRLVNVRGANGCEIDPDGLTIKNPLGGATCGATVTSGSISSAVR
jgi:hypothetical protein